MMIQSLWVKKIVRAERHHLKHMLDTFTQHTFKPYYTEMYYCCRNDSLIYMNSDLLFTLTQDGSRYGIVIIGANCPDAHHLWSQFSIRYQRRAFVAYKAIAAALNKPYGSIYDFVHSGRILTNN